MNPTDTITLIAFLAALTQLDPPLPPEVQTQLKNVASVDDITANIGQLNAIAQNYPDLDEHYQNARDILQLPVSERSKGPLPKINHLTEQEITEITNIAREVANSPEPINAANQATQKSSVLKQLRDSLKTWVNG